MILALKKFTVRRFSGLVLILYKDSILMPDDWRDEVFHMFEKNLLKLQIDTEATRIPPYGDEQFPLEAIYTHTVFESLHRLFQPKDRVLFIPFATVSCLETKTHVSNFPRWISQFFEDKNGDLYEMRPSRGPFTIVSTQDFNHLHISFFSNRINPRLTSNNKIETHCLSHLITRAVYYPLSLSFSIEEESSYNKTI